MSTALHMVAKKKEKKEDFLMCVSADLLLLLLFFFFFVVLLSFFFFLFYVSSWCVPVKDCTLTYIKMHQKQKFKTSFRQFATIYGAIY